MILLQIDFVHDLLKGTGIIGAFVFILTIALKYVYADNRKHIERLMNENKEVRQDYIEAKKEFIAYMKENVKVQLQIIESNTSTNQELVTLIREHLGIVNKRVADRKTG